MREPNIVYFAIHKTSLKLMTGARGQASFEEKATLGRSIGQNYQYQAKAFDCKVKDLYKVYEINLDEAIKSGLASEVK
jgi:hypothetical protein